MSYLTLSDLDSLWHRIGARRGDTVRVLGDYRRGGVPEHREPLLTIRDEQALHPVLELRATPLLEQGGAKLPNGFAYKKSDSPTSKYQEAWSKTLVACGLAAPRVDPAPFEALLQDPRCLKFYFDTNVLASGIAHWLLEVFRGRAHFETSVLVDRELMRWVDRGGKAGFYVARTIAAFQLRTQWRLARQILTARLEGSMIMRPSPDQSALMLAKFRDEGGDKSPDADMLLLEQARLQVRDQPRNTRTIFLTGDRNLAVTAAAVLGSDAVLWIDAGPEVSRPLFGQVCLRGWWEPHGAYGRLHIPPWSHLVRGLLAACDRLIFQVERGDDCASSWTLEQTLGRAVLGALPSDWTDPVFALACEESDAPPRPAPVLPAPTSTSAPAVPAPPPPVETTRAAVVLEPPPVVPEPAAATQPLVFPWAGTPDGALGARSWRMSSSSFWNLLAPLVLEGDGSEALWSAGSALRSAYKSFELLGWMDEEGEPGPNFRWLQQAWNSNDLDALHRALRKLRVYETMMQQLAAHHGSVERPDDRLWRPWWGIARSLGQTAELGGRVYCGDAPASPEQLDRALEVWMPAVGDHLSVRELSELAARELRWSPYRLGRTMAALRQQPANRWSLETGGEFVGDAFEEVARLGEGEYAEDVVDPEGLWMGGPQPVRTLRRIA